MTLLQIDPIDKETAVERHEEIFQNNSVLDFKLTQFDNLKSSQARLWSQVTPKYNGEKTAFVGRFHADTPKLGMELLEVIEHHLKSLGITYMVGPIDQNTWNNYRLVTKGFESPQFALESMTPPHLPEIFLKAGFNSIAKYKSTLVDTDPGLTQLFSKTANRLKNEGVKIRSFDLSHPERDLTILYKISMQGFKNNFLFSKISQTEFKSKYRKLLPVIDPDLILIAEKDDIPVGYIFSLPNSYLESGRDDTVVMKTLVRLSEPELKGLGQVLVGLTHELSYQKGFSKAIHALYKSDNLSSSFSSVNGAVDIREYDLYGKKVC